MIVSGTIFRRLFRNKLSLLLVLVIPPVMISLLLGLGMTGSDAMNVGLVDQDQTPLTRQLEEMLRDQVLVISMKEEAVRGALARSQVSMVLVVEKGFTGDVLAGRQPEVYRYSIEESNLSMPVRMAAEGFIATARSQGLAAQGDENVFYQRMDALRQTQMQVVVAQADGTSPQQAWDAVSAMGILGMNMLFLSFYAAMYLLKDRENRTFHRAMITPLTQRSYLFQMITCFIVIMLIQVAGVFVVSRWLMEMYLGVNMTALFGVMMVFAVVCISLGVAVAANVKSTRHAGTLSSLLVTPMAMLGGLLWPREIMPEVLQHVGLFLPTTWMMQAAGKVVETGRLVDATWELIILMLFALVFFLLGGWRRVDISS
ncbi:ABC transporter permease [Anoxynatronum buryatiense]|uniref:ABC-2 type transport system permease protein n=1 Tax=Anoxynatronum buryatiense TaxID=489973 RepID=A0AA45WXH4_9CLOT|nr:ABC transporter permease [Anoxynatronum buryatiense]SMP63502.1 ABC-2 type transport system permease protein [Anoxynatronum buryatiense]